MNVQLIKVALRIEATNKASAREKSIRHGHTSTLHLWWARELTTTLHSSVETAWSCSMREIA